LDFIKRGGPVLGVGGGGVGLEEAIGFGPGEVGRRGHGEAFVLGAGDAGLDFEVGWRAGSGEEFLPAPAAGGLAPDEHFSTALGSGGGLEEAEAVFVQGGDEGALGIREVVEEIDGLAVVGGIGVVDVVLAAGDGDALELVGEAQAEGGVGGGDDARVPGFGDGDVGPPIHGDFAVVGVENADAGEEEGGGVGEMEVDLIENLADSFEIIEAEDGGVGFAFEAGEEDGGAGEGGVARDGAVEFDSAGEPGVAGGEVGGLENGVGVEEVSSGGFVEEGVESAAELGEEGGL